MIQSFVPLIYDIVTIAMFVYMMSVCARRGFVKTVASFVGYIAALFVAASTAKPLATMFYSAFIRPSMTRSIESKLSGVQAEALPGALYQLVESLPQSLLEAAGFNKAALAGSLQGLAENGGQNAAAAIADAVVQPLVVMLLKMVLFLLIFWVAMFFVRRIVWMVGGVNRLPLIGSVNRLLGGVVGIVQAAVMMYVIAVLLMLLISLGSGELALTIQGQRVTLASQAVFEQTMLFKTFIHSNPLDLLMNQESFDLPAITEGLLEGAEALGENAKAYLANIF